MTPPKSNAEPETRARKTVAISIGERLEEREGALPVWVRCPIRGGERYTGLSRSKLYQLATDRKIRSVSLREPGQIKGTRVFHLRSILNYFESLETHLVS